MEWNARERQEGFGLEKMIPAGDRQMWWSQRNERDRTKPRDLIWYRACQDDIWRQRLACRRTHSIFKGHSEVVALTSTEALQHECSESLLQAYGQISSTAHNTLIRPENTVGITHQQTSPAIQSPLWTCCLGERNTLRRASMLKKKC